MSFHVYIFPWYSHKLWFPAHLAFHGPLLAPTGSYCGKQVETCSIQPGLARNYCYIYIYMYMYVCTFPWINTKSTNFIRSSGFKAHHSPPRRKGVSKAENRGLQSLFSYKRECFGVIFWWGVKSHKRQDPAFFKHLGGKESWVSDCIILHISCEDFLPSIFPMKALWKPVRPFPGERKLVARFFFVKQVPRERSLSDIPLRNGFCECL